MSSVNIPYLFPDDFDEVCDMELEHRYACATQRAVAYDVMSAWLLACRLCSETDDQFVFEDEDIIEQLRSDHRLSRDAAKTLLSSAARFSTDRLSREREHP